MDISDPTFNPIFYLVIRNRTRKLSDTADMSVTDATHIRLSCIRSVYYIRSLLADEIQTINYVMLPPLLIHTPNQVYKH